MSASKTPWLTLALIALNIAAAFAVPFDPDLTLMLGFRASAPNALTALTSLFLHLNLFHLLGNMVFLAAVGPLVEHAAGPARFLSVYLIGGLAGVAGHWGLMAASTNDKPLIGASAAIAACVGYCTVRFMNAEVPLAPKLRLKVGWVALTWAVLQLIGAFVRTGEDSGTAFWAHLAGFLAGLALSVVFRAPAQASRQHGHEMLEQMVDRSPAALLLAAESHLKGHPNDIRALRDKAQAHRDMHDQAAETETLIRLYELVPDSEKGEVLLGLARCKALGRFAPIKRLHLAEQYKTGPEGLSVQLLESILNDPAAEAQRPDALVALAVLVRESDAALCAKLIGEVKKKYALHAAADLARARGLLT